MESGRITNEQITGTGASDSDCTKRKKYLQPNYARLHRNSLYWIPPKYMVLLLKVDFLQNVTIKRFRIQVPSSTGEHYAGYQSFLSSSFVDKTISFQAYMENGKVKVS